MSIRLQLGAVRRRLVGSAYSRIVSWGDRGAVVSFTFDDFPRSAYTTGGSILRNLGVQGTYYAAAGLMNTSNQLGPQFTLDDLHALVEDGHELASHTFSHVSCQSVSAEAFLGEVERGRQAIRQLCGPVESGNFAFPFGEVTLSARKILRSHLPSCRSTWAGFNGPEVDISLLRANSLYGDNDHAERARQLIIENVERGSWLIFYTHDVRPNCSRFGCRPSLLESAVSFALQHGSRVLPVAEVVARLGPVVSEPVTVAGALA